MNDILGPSFATFREVEGASHFDLTTNYADDVLDSCATFVNSLQPDQYLESKAKAGAIIPGKKTQTKNTHTQTINQKSQNFFRSIFKFTKFNCWKMVNFSWNAKI